MNDENMNDKNFISPYKVVDNDIIFEGNIIEQYNYKHIADAQAARLNNTYNLGRFSTLAKPLKHIDDK